MPHKLRSNLRKKLLAQLGVSTQSGLAIPQLWSIGIYEGPSVWDLTPSPLAANPVMTAAAVTDAPAAFVADPFMLRRADGGWWMFFEILNRRTRRGEIALAASSDGFRWDYQQVVLKEPFHLSYPFVFEWEGYHYMIPETAASRTVRLYQAREFPFEWQLVETLASGKYFADSTLFRHAGRWWMFTETSGALPFGELRLYSSDELTGGWVEHPASPLRVGDPVSSRPAGRVVEDGGSLLRFSQNCATRYGLDVRAFQIDLLTATEYREMPAAEQPVLCGSTSGWNEHGMHHLDLHRLDDGRLIACVDGWIDQRL
jgi:hypothetical protein